MYIFIIIFGVFFDLYTKNLAFKYLQNQKDIYGDFLFLKYVENTGIAFSIKIPFLKYLTFFLIIAITYYFFLERKKVQNKKMLDFSFGLILAGAIGNGIERIFNGKVIDFIGVKNFSIFNFADVFINIGIIIYLLFILGVFDQSKEILKKS